MEDVGIYGMITPGTMLFCAGVAGLFFTLIWLAVGIAGRKKREEKIARKAVSSNAPEKTEIVADGLTEGTGDDTLPTQEV
jgi:hypothetical protein